MRTALLLMLAACTTNTDTTPVAQCRTVLSAYCDAADACRPDPGCRTHLVASCDSNATMLSAGALDFCQSAIAESTCNANGGVDMTPAASACMTMFTAR